MSSQRTLPLRVLIIGCLAHSICTMAWAEECGDNPMKQLMLVANKSGRSLDQILGLLVDIDAPAYETLARKFRMYAACVGLVDTGYFRKRAQPDWFRQSPSHGNAVDIDSDTAMLLKKYPSEFMPHTRVESVDTNEKTYGKVFSSLLDSIRSGTASAKDVEPMLLNWPYLSGKWQRRPERREREAALVDILKALPEAEVMAMAPEVRYRSALSYQEDDRRK